MRKIMKRTIRGAGIMKNSYLLLILLILASVSAAYGMVIDIGFNIDKNDHVQLTILDAGQGERQRFFNGKTGPYQVSILDSDNETLDSHDFSVDFWLLSDPPQPLDYSSHSYRLKYYNTADKLVIRHDDKILLERKLASMGNCNENEVCESGENAFNCYRDCNPSDNDNYCTGLADRVCDPDCNKNKDVDCMPAAAPPGLPGRSSPCLPVAGAVLLGALMIRASRSKEVCT